MQGQRALPENGTPRCFLLSSVLVAFAPTIRSTVTSPFSPFSVFFSSQQTFAFSFPISLILSKDKDKISRAKSIYNSKTARRISRKI